VNQGCGQRRECADNLFLEREGLVRKSADTHPEPPYDSRRIEDERGDEDDQCRYAWEQLHDTAARMINRAILGGGGSSMKRDVGASRGRRPWHRSILPAFRRRRRVDLKDPDECIQPTFGLAQQRSDERDRTRPNRLFRGPSATDSPMGCSGLNLVTGQAHPAARQIRFWALDLLAFNLGWFWLTYLAPTYLLKGTLISGGE
jgi:hypothetical protein